MRRISQSVYSEVLLWGCNPSFVATSEGVVLVDSPQQPIDAVRWREQASGHGELRYLINTEPHYDHVAGNSYFPDVPIVAQRGMLARYEATVPNLSAPWRLDRMKHSDPDSVWLFDHPDYPPNPPSVLFDDEWTVRVGEHTLQCLHVPGHTAEQTAVLVVEEGVLLTGDNVFGHVKTFIQEGDPWQWLAALERMDALDFEVLVPGHGEPCGHGGLHEQADVIRRWIEAVSELVTRGLDEAAALAAAPALVASIDPFPIGQRQFMNVDRVVENTMRNVYRQVRGRLTGEYVEADPEAEQQALLAHLKGLRA